MRRSVMKVIRSINSKPLIMMVKQRPCLYDPNDKDYGSRETRAQAWEEIASSMAGSKWESLGDGDRERLKNDIKVRWKSLKDAYIRSLRMKSMPLTNKKTHKPYLYEKHIKFLKASYFEGKGIKEEHEDYEEEEEGYSVEEDEDSHIGDEEVYSFLQVGVEPGEESSTSFQEQKLDPSASRSDQEPSNQEDDGQSNPKRPRLDSSEPNPLSFLQESTASASAAIEFDPNTIPSYIDEDKFFLMSLLPQLKEMSQVEKLDFKIGVMQLLKANVVRRGDKRL